MTIDLTGFDAEIARQQAWIDRLSELRAIVAADPRPFVDLIEKIDGMWCGETEMVWNWLCKPLLRFNDQIPLELIIAGRSEELLTFIRQVEYGVYL